MKVVKSTIPEGKRGNWEVEQFTVSKDEAQLHSLRCMMNGEGGRGVIAGDYTRITRGHKCIMSDTPAETSDLWPLFRAVRDVDPPGCVDVWVAGLGLGVVAENLCLMDEVKSVTVMELDEDVINLVGPTLLERYPLKLQIRQGNALEYKPAKGERYDICYFDIWDDLCVDDLEEHTILKRRWSRRAKFKMGWAEDTLKRIKRQDQRQGWY